ncbi:MAG: lysylphosphatidylglycerol synthase transmembrane domain-containing protein, partial [Acidobacteriota bacterium]
VETTAPRSRRLRGLIQTMIGLGALTLLLIRADFNEITRIMTRVDPLMLLLAMLLNLVMVYLMALRWRQLIYVKYPQVDSLMLFRQYLIGLFFNLFTPGAVGGDFARLLGVGKAVGDRSFIFATLVLERLVGLYGLVLAGIGGIYIGRAYLANPHSYYTIAAVMLIGLLFASTVLSKRMLGLGVNVAVALEARIGRKLISDALSRITIQLGIFPQRYDVIAAGVIYTLLIRLVWVLSCWMVAQALGLALPFSILTAFITIVDIARMVPIAPANGLGVREYLLVLLLAQIGISTSEALLFSFTAYLMLTFNGLIGGLLYSVGGAVSYREQ